MALAERIRSFMSADAVISHAGEIPVTASLGVAVGSDQVGKDTGVLIGAADEALYRAKKAGRNRVES
jgi:diguanylate cyclase (GGDEF)-like protein